MFSICSNKTSRRESVTCGKKTSERAGLFRYFQLRKRTLHKQSQGYLTSDTSSFCFLFTLLIYPEPASLTFPGPHPIQGLSSGKYQAVSKVLTLTFSSTQLIFKYSEWAQLSRSRYSELNDEHHRVCGIGTYYLLVILQSNDILEEWIRKTL